MDYLTLVQRTWQKCGLSGAGPITILAQTNINARIVQYVSDAYLFVQQQHQDWAFHWAQADSALILGQSVYGSAADFGITDFREIDRVLLQVDSKWQPLCFELNPAQAAFDNPGTDLRPTKLTMRPDRNWVLNTTPDETYPIRFEYYRTAHMLTADADVPLVPTDFQWVIIWKALEYYANYDEDVSLREEAIMGYKSTLHRMEREYLPELTFAPSPFLQ